MANASIKRVELPLKSNQILIENLARANSQFAGYNELNGAIESDCLFPLTIHDTICEKVDQDGNYYYVSNDGTNFSLNKKDINGDSETIDLGKAEDAWSFSTEFIKNYKFAIGDNTDEGVIYYNSSKIYKKDLVNEITTELYKSASKILAVNYYNRKGRERVYFIEDSLENEDKFLRYFDPVRHDVFNVGRIPVSNVFPSNIKFEVVDVENTIDSNHVFYIAISEVDSDSERASFQDFIVFSEDQNAVFTTLNASIKYAGTLPDGYDLCNEVYLDDKIILVPRKVFISQILTRPARFKFLKFFGRFWKKPKLEVLEGNKYINFSEEVSLINFDNPDIDELSMDCFVKKNEISYTIFSKSVNKTTGLGMFFQRDSERTSFKREVYDKSGLFAPFLNTKDNFLGVDLVYRPTKKTFLDAYDSDFTLGYRRGAPNRVLSYKGVLLDSYKVNNASVIKYNDDEYISDYVLLDTDDGCAVLTKYLSDTPKIKFIDNERVVFDTVFKKPGTYDDQVNSYNLKTGQLENCFPAGYFAVCGDILFDELDSQGNKGSKVNYTVIDSFYKNLPIRMGGSVNPLYASSNGRPTGSQYPVDADLFHFPEIDGGIPFEFRIRYFSIGEFLEIFKDKINSKGESEGLRFYKSYKQKYLGDTNGQENIVNNELEGQSYGIARVLYAINYFQSIESAITDFVIIKNELGDKDAFFSEVDFENKPLFLYNYLSLIEDFYELFCLNGSYFVIKNNKIYSAQLQYNKLSGLQPIVDATGLKFVGTTYTEAIFFQQYEKKLVVFQGNYALQELLDVSKFDDLVFSRYFPSTNLIVMKVSKEDNTFSYVVFNEVWHELNLDGDYKDFIMVPKRNLLLCIKEGGATEIKIEAVDNKTSIPVSLKTNFFGFGTETIGRFNCWLIRLFRSKKTTEGKLTISQNSYTDIYNKGDKQELTILPDDFDENGIYYFRFQPRYQEGNSFQLELTSDFPVSSIVAEIQADSHSQLTKNGSFTKL